MPVSVTLSSTYWPGRDVAEVRGVLLVEIGVCGLDRQAAAVRHGVARIDGQVDHGVLELVGVRERRPKPPASTVSTLMVSPSVRRSISDMPETSPVEIETLGLEGLAARECKQAVRELAALRAPCSA